MKKRLITLLTAALVVAAAVWIVDKIPFTQSIDQEITAAVYRDGQIIDNIVLLLYILSLIPLSKESASCGRAFSFILVAYFSIRCYNACNLSTKGAYSP